MNLRPAVRLLTYTSSIAAFIVFGCHFFIKTQKAATEELDQDDWDLPVRGKRDVLKSPQPRVNTMCAEASDVFLLVLINSAPQNFYLRWTIRQTWGKQREYNGLNIRLAFVVGRASKDARTNHLVGKESSRTNDIVSGGFDDTYYNLTAKTLFGMSWVRQYCSNARYVMKGDDDVIMIPPNIIDYIQGLPSKQAELLYEGACQVNHEPMRAKGNKWFISEEDYPNTTYPPYQLGVAVLHSFKSLDSLYQACHSVPTQLDVPLSFPFDDVFIGICARLTDVQPTCNNHIIVYKDRELRQFLRSRRQTCLLATTLAVHGVSHRSVVQRRWRLANGINRERFHNCTFNFTTAAT